MQTYEQRTALRNPSRQSTSRQGDTQNNLFTIKSKEYRTIIRVPQNGIDKYISPSQGPEFSLKKGELHSCIYIHIHYTL